MGLGCRIVILLAGQALGAGVGLVRMSYRAAAASWAASGAGGGAAAAGSQLAGGTHQ